MKYEIILNKKVVKFLESHNDIYNRFAAKAQELSSNPYDNNLDIKKLRGIDDHYRMRISKYRFLFQIKNNELMIYFVDADSRGDIY